MFDLESCFFGLRFYDVRGFYYNIDILNGSGKFIFFIEIYFC